MGSNRKKRRAEIEETFDSFGIDRGEIPDKEKLVKDMLRMYRRYGFDFDEYLYYRFSSRTLPERLEFVANWEHRGYAWAMNEPKNRWLFQNKWKTYEKYRRFYRREVCCCGPDAEVFLGFVRRHPRFIAKPLDKATGRGIAIYTAEDRTTGEALHKKLLKKYGGWFLAEELIPQAPETAVFHPASLNTVRVPTIRTDTETVLYHPLFRMGQHGSVVDNSGAGGIFGVMDAQTGRVFAAVDELGHVYEKHPETGEQIVGFTIPRWDEAVAFVKELVQVTPENRYTGWDIALTEEGWVLVEANADAQFGWQIPLQQGCRKEMDGILQSMGLKY